MILNSDRLIFIARAAAGKFPLVAGLAAMIVLISLKFLQFIVCSAQSQENNNLNKSRPAHPALISYPNDEAGP
jgi:hypothetical protein